MDLDSRRAMHLETPWKVFWTAVRRLGHSSIAVTLGIYSHATATMHDDAAETVATLLRKASSDRPHTLR